MSSLRYTAKEEAEARYDAAETVEDWRGNYIWAAYMLINTKRSLAAIRRIWLRHSNPQNAEKQITYTDDDEGIGGALFRQFAEALQEVKKDHMYSDPQFLNEEENPDPVAARMTLHEAGEDIPPMTDAPSPADLMEERFHLAETAEDWKGSFVWAVSWWARINRTAHAIEQISLKDSSPDRNREYFSEYLETMQKVWGEPWYRDPDFLFVPADFPDPVYDKVLEKDQEMLDIALEKI